MSEFLNTEELVITDSEKWLLRQDDTTRVEFAIDATNGDNPVVGSIVALNSDGKGILWGKTTTTGTGDDAVTTYDNEAYGILMSTGDFSVEALTLSVLTMGIVDQRRITAVVTGSLVADAKANLRKNNIIVKECE